MQDNDVFTRLGRRLRAIDILGGITLTTKIGLISETDNVSPDELATVAIALQSQAIEDLPMLWPDRKGIVNAFPNLSSALAADHLPVIIRDNLGANGEGVHFASGNATGGHPFALVLFEEDVWPITASHEIIEMIVDPSLSLTVSGPSPSDINEQAKILVEVCDPCQNISYQRGTIKVSDFCSPRYYSDSEALPSVSYSFTDAIKGPRQVLEGGYISWQDATGGWHRLDVFEGIPLLRDIDPPDETGGLRVGIDHTTPIQRENMRKLYAKDINDLEFGSLRKRRENALQLAALRADNIHGQISRIIKTKKYHRPPNRRKNA